MPDSLAATLITCEHCGANCSDRRTIMGHENQLPDVFRIEDRDELAKLLFCSLACVDEFLATGGKRYRVTGSAMFQRSENPQATVVHLVYTRRRRAPAPYNDRISD